MPRIELDPIVPEDITFVYRGNEYAIPGDLDVDSTFDLIDLLGRHGEAEEKQDRAAMRQVNEEIQAKLLGLFQQRNPELSALPFGVIGYRFVLSHVLVALGLQVVEDEPEIPPKPGRAKKSPSRRSTGSRA